jgi:hypothetical protein
MAIANDLPEQLREILQLRLLVAAMGERSAPPLWRTQFLTEVGIRALTRIFPRTAASAALTSVLAVARESHDKRIGVGGRYHLFRLPTNLEHAITLLMSEPSFGSLATAVAAKRVEELVQEIGRMANGRAVEAAEGPIKLGVATRIVGERTSTSYS